MIMKLNECTIGNDSQFYQKKNVSTSCVFSTTERCKIALNPYVELINKTIQTLEWI